MKKNPINKNQGKVPYGTRLSPDIVLWLREQSKLGGNAAMSIEIALREKYGIKET